MSPDNKEAMSEFMKLITRNEKYDMNSFLRETTKQMQKAYTHMQVVELLSAASPISIRGPVIEIQDDHIYEDYDDE